MLRSRRVGSYARRPCGITRTSLGRMERRQLAPLRSRATRRRLLKQVRIGRTREESNLLPGEMGISDLPVTYPLLRAGGALLLLCDDASREAARNILQSILLRAALAYARGGEVLTH